MTTKKTAPKTGSIKAALITEAVKRTRESFRPKTSKLSKKGQQAETALQAIARNLGSYKNQVAAIFTDLLGSPVSPDVSFGLLTGSLCVPKESKNSSGAKHGHKVGKAFFVPDNVQTNGGNTIAGNLNFSKGHAGKNIEFSRVRAASQREIEDFFGAGWNPSQNAWVVRTLTTAAKTV